MAKKEFTGITVTLPTCRLLYPVLFDMKRNDLKGKDEWSTTMLFDKKDENIDKKGKTGLKTESGQDIYMTLKEAMIQAAKNEFGNAVDLKTLDLKRIKDGDAPKSDGEPRRAEYKGQWFVKASTSLKAPGIVDATREKILDPSEIYSGVYANVNVTVKGYVKGVNKGVTLYLNHVQKVKDGEQIAGGPKAQDVFEELDIEATDSQVDAGAEDMAGMFG